MIYIDDQCRGPSIKEKYHILHNRGLVVLQDRICEFSERVDASFFPSLDRTEVTWALGNFAKIVFTLMNM